MRTTLTLEEDVAIEIERRRRERGTSMKREVNELLRAGLAHQREPVRQPTRFRTPALDIGPPLIEDFDDVEGVLEMSEGPWRS